MYIYVHAKLQKHTNNYNSLHFLTETNTSGSKTPTLWGKLLIYKDLFCVVPCTILYYDPNTHLLQYMVCKLTHFQPHMFGFSDVENLLGSTPETELHMQ